MPHQAASAPVKPTEKGRPVAGRPLGNFDNNGADKDTRPHWRTQYLMERCHVSPSLGDLISSLHYGEGRDA